MTPPPTFTTHLRDAAFHARNAARSLDAAQEMAPTEWAFNEIGRALAAARLTEEQATAIARVVESPAGSGAR